MDKHIKSAPIFTKRDDPIFPFLRMKSRADTHLGKDRVGQALGFLAGLVGVLLAAARDALDGLGKVGLEVNDSV